MNAHAITFLRKWNPGRDAIAHDQRCNKQKRGVYLHRWPTGSQLLVFDSPQDAERFKEALNKEQS